MWPVNNIQLGNILFYNILYKKFLDAEPLRKKKKKSGITDSINHNPGRISIDSYNSLPIEKKLTLYIVIILIKSAFNRDKDNCYCNVFLEKELYKESRCY